RRDRDIPRRGLRRRGYHRRLDAQAAAALVQRRDLSPLEARAGHRRWRGAARGQGRDGRLTAPMHLRRLRLTAIRLLGGVALIGSSAFILCAILKVRDTSQIPMLSSGFAILGLAFVAVAIGALIQLWRAAAMRRMGRAMGLAVLGGLLGLAAIGCFTATVVFA